MLKSFFDTSLVDDFVARAVKDVTGSLTPAQAEDDAQGSVKQREQAEARARRHAETFAARAPLNFYKKALLGMRLGDALETAGYPKAFSKSISYAVVSVIAQAASKRH